MTPPPSPLSPANALLQANARWARAISQADPGFFHQTTLGQFPKVLWIGCADSRVPESLITGSRPGDIFVHRNVANQFHPDDDSALAVLAYAIGVVGVEEVVLAGHTHCGGAAACYDAVVAARTANPPNTATATTPLARWLAPLTDHIASLDLAAKTPADALDHIVEQNVVRQVQHVCDAEPVRAAWAAGSSLRVHGWVYDLATGRIRDLEISRGRTSA